MDTASRADAGPTPSSSPDSSGSGAGATAREPLWDTLRWVAIALVVIGHSVEARTHDQLAYGLYLWIYAFHVPLFAFVSGIVLRSDEVTPSRGWVVVRQLVVPYVTFSVLWGLLRWWVEGGFVLNLASPYWHLWFLVALAVWRLSVPLFASVRWPVLWAVMLACTMGYFDGVGWQFDASRIFSFLPFFVLGWALARHGAIRPVLRVLRLPVVRVVSGVVLAGTLAVAIFTESFSRQHALRAWLQAQSNFADIGEAHWYGGLVRLGCIGLACLLVAAVVSVVPRVIPVVTAWGAVATMYVYMLHLVPIYVLRTRYDVLGNGTGWLPTIAIVGSALLLAAVTSILPVRWLTRTLVEPRLRWLRNVHE
ncbi:acyltransferase family protein [Luteimicrobium album]|uniref:acyltransferase family protein n=1 Tax=Luteimicrobium album TaxID=1054550 RepID=UPI0024E0EC59|nr:acyltransferase family protein [Luteimicrobium album]